ncbi:MAG: GNAT family N-acetyltransferase [Vicingaceae bacterium]
MEKLELIVDENTSLFLYQEEDAQELFELVDSNRNYFKQWLPWLSYNTKVEDTHQFILEGNANYKKRVSLNLGIKYQDKIVGSVSFNTINLIHKNAEIGYMLGQNCTGKGLVTKCCKVLIEYGFEKLELPLNVLQKI